MTHNDLNRIRAFVVTVEQGSLSAAAKYLGSTQPTISRQVQALEDELGVTLFERGARTLLLTESGSLLLEQAQPIVRAAESFSLAAAGQSQEITGKVTVSVGQLDAEYRMPKILERIEQLEPGIQVEILVTNHSSDLTRREADIALRNYRPTQPNLIIKKIGTEKIWLVGSKSYIRNLESGWQPKIIGFDDTDTVTNILNEKGWRISQEDIRLITAYQPLQIELCKRGMGLIFLSDKVINSSKDFVIVKSAEYPIMELPIWLVSHQELRTNIRVRRVFDFMAQELVSQCNAT